MGIKSTRHLTRAEAETKFRDLWTELYVGDIERAIQKRLARLIDEELENELEEMNDEAVNLRQGDTLGGFDNYVIQEKVDG